MTQPGSTSVKDLPALFGRRGLSWAAFPLEDPSAAPAAAYYGPFLFQDCFPDLDRNALLAIGLTASIASEDLEEVAIRLAHSSRDRSPLAALLESIEAFQDGLAALERGALDDAFLRFERAVERTQGGDPLWHWWRLVRFFQLRAVEERAAREPRSAGAAPSEVVARGVSFLLSRQRAEGSWSDFLASSHFSPSDVWVTGYVGCALARLRSSRPGLDQALDRAAAFLRARLAARGGFGYDLHEPPDADSTAFCLRFLAAVERLPPDPEALLLPFQDPATGGFRTFLPGVEGRSGGWCEPHPDVTASCVLALGDLGPAALEAGARAKSYLRSVQRPDGHWEAYWWNEPPVHATAMGALALEDLPGDQASLRALEWLRRTPPRPSEPLRAAWKLAALAGGGASVETYLALARAQDEDGSFQGERSLRVPDRSDREPWTRGPIDDPPGLDVPRLFRDQNRVYTTAAAVAAADAYSRRPGETSAERSSEV